MHRLLYISTARKVIEQDELDTILRTSRRNNAAVAVTGLLIVGGRRFLQALEGQRDAVMTVYDRIARDPRHFAIVQLANQPIAERAFAGWTMGYQPGGTYKGDGAVADQVAALVAPIADPTLRAYFTGFAEKHAAA